MSCVAVCVAVDFTLISSPFSFSGSVDGIRDWLKQMELSLKNENVAGVESQRGASDAAEELERMDNFYRDLRARRCAHLSRLRITIKMPDIQHDHVAS